MTETLTTPPSADALTDNVRNINTAPTAVLRKSTEQYEMDKAWLEAEPYYDHEEASDTEFNSGALSKEDMVLEPMQGRGERRHRRATSEVTTIGDEAIEAQELNKLIANVERHYPYLTDTASKTTEEQPAADKTLSNLDGIGMDPKGETKHLTHGQWQQTSEAIAKKQRDLLPDGVTFSDQEWQDATGEKPEPPKWDVTEKAADYEDPWYRTLSEDAKKALANHIARRKGEKLPYSYDDEANQGAQKVERRVERAVQIGAWVIEHLPAEQQAAIDSLKARYDEKRADLAMIPESKAGDDPYVRSLDKDGLRALDKIAYRYEKRQRERAKQAATGETAQPKQTHQEILRKVIRTARWLGVTAAKASAYAVQVEAAMAKSGR